MSEQDPPGIRRAAPGETVAAGSDIGGSEEAGTGHGGTAAHPPVPDGPVRWRVRPVLPVLKGVGAALFLAVGLLSAGDRGALVIGVGCALALGAMALRDVVAATRLAADPAGVTVVTGYAGRHRLPWSQVVGLRLDRRSRLGVHSELVEVDAGEQLYLFSRNELGAPCPDVLATLEALRARAGTEG